MKTNTKKTSSLIAKTAGLLIILALIAIMIIALSSASFASEEDGYKKGEIVDWTLKISDSTKQQIQWYIDEAYEKYNCSIVINYNNYVNSDDSKRNADAEKFYLDGNYCDDGVLLYVGTMSRSFDIYVRHGKSKGIITSREGDKLASAILPYLKANDWNGAALKFAQLALEYAGNGSTETFILNKSLSQIFVYFLISVAIAFVISLIIVSVMKKKMNTIRKQSGAAGYIVKDSFVLTESRDSFLYSTVSKVPKPQSSSGSSGGGGGSSRSGGGSHHGGHF